MSVEALRPQLGAHAEALIADVLDKRENAIINGVLSKLPNVEPQDALAAWIALSESRKLRHTLIKRALVENARQPQQL